MANLLKNRFILRIFLSKGFPLTLQIIFLLFFLLLIIGGLIVPDCEKGLVNTMRNTNLATLVVWSLWWPAIILSAVLLGRIWCQVCPMELINSLLSKVGLKKKAPLFFKSGWAISIFYTIILFLIIHTFWAHRYPRRMALYLLLLFAVTIALGLIYEKRSFCNYVCPVGHLLGLYALCAPFEWRAKDMNICHQCSTKDCVSPMNYNTILARSCTSNLYPAAIKDNRRCLLCTQCLKVCPYKNLRFSLRKPMLDFSQSLRLKSSELFFIFIVSGFMIYEIYVEWKVAKAILLYVPNQINAYLGFSGESANFVAAIVMFALFPAIVYSIPLILTKISDKKSILDTAKNFSIIILPVMAAAHILKSVFKITSRLPYYALAVNDPLGENTANALVAGELQLNRTFLESLGPFLSMISIFLLMATFIFSTVLLLRRSEYGQNLAQKIPVLIGLILYSSIFVTMVIFWRF